MLYTLWSESYSYLCVGMRCEMNGYWYESTDGARIYDKDLENLLQVLYLTNRVKKLTQDRQLLLRQLRTIFGRHGEKRQRRRRERNSATV